MVYSTLAGDQYDKIIVPRNEGATTKTNLTGEGGGRSRLLFIHSSFLSLFAPLITIDICFARRDASYPMSFNIIAREAPLVFYMVGLSLPLTPA